MKIIDLDKLERVVSKLEDSLERFEAAAETNLKAANIAEVAASKMFHAAEILKENNES
jgi:hypothetical protein